MFFLSYVVPKPIYDHFTSLIGTGLFFLWAFCKLGFSHPGKGYRFCAVLVWNPGATPCNGLYTEAPPERGTFFRLQERYVRKFELQAPTTEVWHDSDRASISPSGSIRPVPDPDIQIGGGGWGSSRFWDKRGGPVSKKKFFSALRASFWSKTKGAPDSPAPSPRYATEDNRRLCSSTKNKEKNVSKP